MSRRPALHVVLAVALAQTVWVARLDGRDSQAASTGVETSRQASDHAGHVADQTKPAPVGGDRDDHSKHASPPRQDLPSGIPRLADADRAAAFPDVEGHSIHDNAVNYFVLLDQLEWQTGQSGHGGAWDNRGWIGGDRDRFWFRTEGTSAEGRVDDAQTHLFYGRAIARWWDLVVGVRQDMRPGPAQTWAAIGVQGLAPYWFEVEATAYVGASGRNHVRLEAEYDLLLTNRLVLQPLVEVEIYGKADPERRVGAGLSTAEAGLRLRYELRREIAPYLGITWHRRFFGTADFAKAAGFRRERAHLALGVRFWF
jgi:copper resistance protein B